METEKPLTTLRVYPNPVEDMCRIEYSGFTGRVTATITDMFGNMVTNLTMPSNREGSSYLRVSDFASGIYVVSLSDGTLFRTQRLVVR